MTDDTLIYDGSDCKALGSGRVGGYLVRFGTPQTADVQGDFFHAATDFGRAVKAGTDVVYHHGLSRRGDAYSVKLGNRTVGDGVLSIAPDGLTIEATLDVSDPDIKALYGDIEREALGWSSGSTERLVRRTAVAGKSRIDRWPIIEASLSPRPVDPRNRAYALKSLIEDAAVAVPSLVERAETLVADVAALKGLIDKALDQRRAEGRTLSHDKRAAIKALGDALAALHASTAPRPDSAQRARLRARLALAGLLTT